MFPKAHLTSHSRMSGFRWVSTPVWLSRSLKPFLYSFSVYPCHLLLISAASVKSLPFPTFITPILAWSIPLVVPVFLKRSLVFLIIIHTYFWLVFPFMIKALTSRDRHQSNKQKLLNTFCCCCCSVTQSCQTLCDPMYCRLLRPSPTPGACSNSYSWSQWCHPTISSLVVPFSSYLQSFPSSGSFIMSWLFTSAGQITGASALALLPILNFFHLITSLQTLMSDYFWISCQLVSEK